MVSAHDDMPTHDVHGTDLRRVRRMLQAGFKPVLIAESLGITFNQAAYAIAVATNDREGAPTEEEIAAICLEIQRGWTPEMAAAAKHGEARLSSTVVRDPTRMIQGRIKQRLALAQIREKRIASEPLSIVFHSERLSSLKYELRVSYCDKCAKRCFATRDEAEAFGREWLREQHKRHVDACHGR